MDFWCEFTTPIHVSAAVIVFAGVSIGEVMRNEMGGVRKTWLLREDEERWRRVYRYSEVWEKGGWDSRRKRGKREADTVTGSAVARLVENAPNDRGSRDSPPDLVPVPVSISASLEPDRRCVAASGLARR